MTRRVFATSLAALACLALPGAAASQPGAAPPTPDGAMAAQVSAAISGQLGRGDTDGALRGIAAAMKSEATAQSLKGSLEAVKGFGRNQYVDRVHARDYGRTNKDIIDKLNFDGNTLYVRYLFSVEDGEWRLINFGFKTETTLPFPRDWVHIDP